MALKTWQRTLAAIFLLASPITACTGKEQEPTPPPAPPAAVLAAFVTACSKAAEEMYPGSASTQSLVDDENAMNFLRVCAAEARRYAFNPTTNSIDGPGTQSVPSGTYIAGMETALKLTNMGVITEPQGAPVTSFVANALAEQREILAQQAGGGK